MVHFSQRISLLALALTSASASPLSTRSTVSGTNTGSLYSLSADQAAHDIFYQSGSCGLSTYFKSVPTSAHLVAMPDQVMVPHGASQHNTLCGKTVTLKEVGTGKKMTAVVADTNFSKEHSIDMTLAVWEFFGRNPKDADNKGFKIEWSINA